jgi:ribosomal protein S18 acetylase RimI-like enzyme
LEEKEFNNFTVTRATDRDSGEAHNILQMRLAPNKDGSSENGFLRPSYSKEEFENFQKEGDLYVAKNDDEVIGFAVATPYNGSAFKVEKMVLLIMANVVEPLRREDTGWRESLNLLRNDGALYLGLLGVRPENQGEGIGKALIEKIREEKGGAAIVATFSESPLKNLAAAEFFRKVGFTLGGVFRLPLRPIEHYDENNIMSYHWLRGFGSRLVILSK